MAPDARTPVLVGAGVAHQRLDDPAAALEAVALMATAAERAATDAGAPEILARDRGGVRAARHLVVSRPGAPRAERFGASARSVVAELGVLQQTLFTRACLAIADGDLDVAVVCGGEAKYRDLRARITGTPVHDTEQLGGSAPDDTLVPASEILPPPEIAAGLISAPLQYSVLETALRAARGETVAENAARQRSCGPRPAGWPPRIPTRGGGIP